MTTDRIDNLIFGFFLTIALAGALYFCFTVSSCFARGEVTERYKACVEQCRVGPGQDTCMYQCQTIISAVAERP